MHTVPPSGDQFEITAGGYRAVVTESGAALRSLTHEGRALLHGFDEGEMTSGGRGQLLMPWPNRLRDGHYSFDGQDHQLALTEPARHNASHGLVRWAAWTPEEHSASSISLSYRLMAQTGYPWTVDLHVLYDLSADGLHVTQTATNLATSPAPYACGAHPYLCLGDAIEGLELTVPARTRLLTDPERLLPRGQEPVAGTDADFSVGRVIGDAVLDVPFGDLEYVEGRVTALLRDPDSGRGVSLWADERHRWLQVFTPPVPDGRPRPGIAIEPMTAPADAFNSGTDLVTLAPAGEPGDELSVSWGIQATG